MATDANINITSASLRGSPSDRIIKPRPRKDSLQSISGSDSHPGRVVKPRARKSPGSGAKRSEPAKRKFICSFSHYGCDVALSSKNEWKRHVSIQHLQLGFYRCDVGSCNPDLNPSLPGHKRVYNDFNRKDLFTQHHRRMHKPDSGPGSSPTTESSKDWRAFEDSLEQVRQRCWQERRKPPQRSTCGFCGRVFEGEGSWNERMEHVGGHFSRDVIEAKEEREDEDLTTWAVQEGIIKEIGNGRHILIDQPPASSERPYVSRDRDIQMTDAPITPTHPPDTYVNHSAHLAAITPKEERFPPNQLSIEKIESPNRQFNNSFPPPPTTTTRPTSAPKLQPTPQQYSPFSSGPPLAPTLVTSPVSAPILAPAPSSRPTLPNPERRGYNVAPPPLDTLPKSPTSPTTFLENGSGDRLEDLINQLIKPKPPKSQRRLTWKCDCNLEISVDIDDADSQSISNLQEISIVCSKTTNAYLKAAKAGSYHVVACDELENFIRTNSKQPVERSGRS